MMAFFVVQSQPPFRDQLNLLQAVEDARVEHFVAVGSAKSFDERAQLRFTWLNE